MNVCFIAVISKDVTFCAAVIALRGKMWPGPCLYASMVGGERRQHGPGHIFPRMRMKESKQKNSHPPPLPIPPWTDRHLGRAEDGTNAESSSKEAAYCGCNVDAQQNPMQYYEPLKRFNVTTLKGVSVSQLRAGRSITRRHHRRVLVETTARTLQTHGEPHP